MQSNAIAIGTSFEIYIPIDLRHSLTLISIELEDSLSFRLRAVGEAIDGSPRRSKTYLFFPHGSYSLLSEKNMSTMDEIGVTAYKATITKKTTKKGAPYWEITFPPGNNTICGPTEDLGLKWLQVDSYAKDYDDAIVLASVDCEDGQAIYLQ